MSSALETKAIENVQPYLAPVEGSDWQPYRAVSRQAVISVVLGGLSVLGLGFPSLLFLPIVAVIMGVIARRSIRKYPLELTGTGLAAAGIVLGIFFFVGGAAMHTVIFLTEVPEGYQRITFYELQPDKTKREPLPERAFELNNQLVFIKGYVHPGVQGMGKVNHFVLVPDMGTCCFGGQPKMSDMIEVHLPGDNGIKYSTTTRKLWGKFEVSPQLRHARGLSDVVYQLHADGAQ